MRPLQSLITRLDVASLAEINEAIFSHPDTGLIEALSRTLGEVREKEILDKVAEALQVPLLDDGEVEADETVIEDAGIALEPLVARHKALPLSWSESNGKRTVKLAMSNPLDEEAIEAFSELYGMSVSVCLARERAVTTAFVSRASSLVIDAREVVKSRPDSTMENVQRYAEDPEVRKAIQQVIATAVKHTVDKVTVSLENPFTRAVFSFEDGEASSVEISVSTAAFVAGILRRGQILERRSSSFSAACRIDFKASAVNCTLELVGESSANGSGGEEEALSLTPIWRTLVLTDFSIEQPDDPNFWRSIPEENSLELRKLFKNQVGMFLVVGREDEARNQAIRAISQSYPDIHVVEAVDNLSLRPDLFEQAELVRVLVGLNKESVFTTLVSLRSLSRESRELVRGILGYYHVPRICECCAEPSDEELEQRNRIPEYVELDDLEFRKGIGCQICGDQGFLGVAGVCSIFRTRREAGRKFIEGGSFAEIASALANAEFESLWENGIRAAGRGKTSLAMALNNLPEPPDEYHSGRDSLTDTDFSLNRVEGAVPVDSAGGSEMRSESSSGGDGASSVGVPRGKEGVVTGREVFTSRVEKNSAVDEDSLDLPLIPIEGDEQAAEVQSAKKETVLLVIDDDPDQRAILRRVFELEGYVVECAADGIDGIVSANRIQPNLIIVDFMMPDLDGRETIRRLKKAPSTADIPIVALTAYPDPDVEYGLLKAGADDFCSKSVSKKVLLKRIERLVPAE